MTVLIFKVTVCSYIGFMLICKQKILLYSENKIYVFCCICTLYSTKIKRPDISYVSLRQSRDVQLPS
jgi:hypothetical protein